jgi:hypothetical protein
MTYFAQLRDRRWQRKRLKILERDGWRCQNPKCRHPDDDAVFLVVHHHVYLPDKMAWEYADAELTTFCHRCHGNMHRKDNESLARFMEGEFYSWKELSPLLGFAPTPYLTNANGKIVCGTFRKDLNPDAPGIVLPGKSKAHWAQNAVLLCQQSQSIPVFTKEAGLPWEYHGRFGGESYTRNAAEIAIHQKRAAGRAEPISLVLFLRKENEREG